MVSFTYVCKRDDKRSRCKNLVLHRKRVVIFDKELLNSDMHKFVELYKSFGIDLEPRLNDDEYIIKLKESNEGFDGYLWFFSTVAFEINGKFKVQGFWE